MKSSRKVGVYVVVDRAVLFVVLGFAGFALGNLRIRVICRE